MAACGEGIASTPWSRNLSPWTGETEMKPARSLSASPSEKKS